MSRKVLIMLGMLCALFAVKANADDFAYAYCPLGEGYVFLYDSLTGFQVMANLKCGEKLTIVDGRDKDRSRVRLADGREGYVMKSSLNTPPAGSQQGAGAPPNASTQQPPAQARPQPQPKPEPPPQPKVLEQPQPKPEPQPQPQAQPQPPIQPQPQPQVELQAQAQAQPESKPEPRLEAEAQPQPQPQPKVKSEPQAQPAPAATAFTPFSTFGYEHNVPRLEAFAGVSYLNAGTTGLASRQNAAGFEGSVAINVNRWLGGEGNFSGYYKTIKILNVGTFGFHDIAAMGGPRFHISKAFVHALVGIDHMPGSWNFYAWKASTPSNVLAGAVGGGVQWNVTRLFALRTSGDYFLSRFGGLTQNNFRLTLGIVYEAGSVKSRGE